MSAGELAILEAYRKAQALKTEVGESVSFSSPAWEFICLFAAILEQPPDIAVTVCDKTISALLDLKQQLQGEVTQG